MFTGNEAAQASEECMQEDNECDKAVHVSEHSESEVCDNSESSCQSGSEDESPECISDAEAIHVLSGSDCADLSAGSNESIVDVRKGEMKLIAVHYVCFFSCVIGCQSVVLPCYWFFSEQYCHG